MCYNIKIRCAPSKDNAHKVFFVALRYKAADPSLFYKVNKKLKSQDITDKNCR